MNPSFLITPPPRLDQPFESGGGAGGGEISKITRRSFIKRTGGATVATVVAWNAFQSIANAIETDQEDNSSSWQLEGGKAAPPTQTDPSAEWEDDPTVNGQKTKYRIVLETNFIPSPSQSTKTQIINAQISSMSSVTIQSKAPSASNWSTYYTPAVAKSAKSVGKFKLPDDRLKSASLSDVDTSPHSAITIAGVGTLTASTTSQSETFTDSAKLNLKLTLVVNRPGLPSNTTLSTTEEITVKIILK